MDAADRFDAYLTHLADGLGHSGRRAGLDPEHERRFTGFDDKIIAIYARGMTVREIQDFLLETYGTEVSPDLISSVTDAVMDEVTVWQSRPLEPVYPVVFFDALRVKIREDAVVRNKAIYLALGVQTDGSREILGMWIESTEGAKFWMKVFNDLKTRGVSSRPCGALAPHPSHLPKNRTTQ